jgi:hypothetical protein
MHTQSLSQVPHLEQARLPRPAILAHLANFLSHTGASLPIGHLPGVANVPISTCEKGDVANVPISTCEKSDVANVPISQRGKSDVANVPISTCEKYHPSDG